MNAHILVVDDDRNLLELLSMRLESAGHSAVPVLSGADAVDAVKKEVFDLFIIDLQLADTDGITLMEKLRSLGADMPVIILTAHGSIESAVEAVKRGAFNYLTKPFDPQNLLLQVERALENRQLTTEVRRLKELLREQAEFSNIVARSEKMLRILEEVSHVARTDSTVCILGESGTGKELIARAIHLGSPRSEKPFIAINCAAIPESLLESELFGFEKGSFSGATRTSKGLFAQADGGTLFLDEIGDMPLSVQVKLLRVLQERRFYPLGSEKPTEVDVRVLVATNKNLEAEVKKGSFREDLFYRIHVIPILLPPLRERKDDIPLLATHFLNKTGRQMGKKVKGFSPSAMQRLMLYDWPGNVRELGNVVEYAVAMTREPMITEELIFQLKPDQVEPVRPLKEARDDFEKNYLTQLLRLTAGNISKAANMAGKYRPDFYHLMKKYGLKPENFKK